MYNSEWKDLFTYTKNERKGIFILSIIIILLIIYNIAGPFSINDKTDFKEFRANIANYEAAINDKSKEIPLKKPTTNINVLSKSKMHFFDPNTIHKKEWLAMGVKEYQVNSILKYLKKGGSFNYPDDIRKMYCLTKRECDIIVPFINIELKELLELEYSESSTKYSPKTYNIELNTATMDSFLLIYGIGPSTAKSIIEYRKILGGFYDKSQLIEVFLIDSAKFNSISSSFYINDSLFTPSIDINSATYYTLKNHPYISKTMSYHIIEYRKHNGSFTQLEQLKSVDIITDSIYNRIYRYFAPLK
ncbi:MAG: helix-hairpin-helix domain-containing protein [Bacteroidales bacterium]|nr:helix-hairpin-helix domain-containing protein [Bacteroidales bacterium]